MTMSSLVIVYLVRINRIREHTNDAVMFCDISTFFDASERKKILLMHIIRVYRRNAYHTYMATSWLDEDLAMYSYALSPLHFYMLAAVNPR